MNAVIGIVLGLVLLIAVALPVTYDVITSSNTTGKITGTTATVVNLLPLGIAIGALAFVFMGVVGKNN